MREGTRTKRKGGYRDEEGEMGEERKRNRGTYRIRGRSGNRYSGILMGLLLASIRS
jgi:hypothetical protein